MTNSGSNLPPLPSPAELVREAAGVPEINYPGIALEIINKLHVVVWSRTIYLYRDGFHQKDDGLVDFEIQEILLKRGFDETKPVTEAKRQIRSYIIDSGYSVEFPFNKHPDLFNIRNGILKINLQDGTAQLMPHSPEFVFNYKAAANYNEEAESEGVEEYLQTLMPDYSVLVQIPAHAVLSALGNVYKIAYFLKGPADSGKSTYLNMLQERFFGTEMCSNVSLQDLLSGGFKLPELEGKIANIYADLSDQKVRDLGRFKTLTGGDYFTAERKHQQPVRFKNQALLIFSANKFPKIDVSDPAFWSRWVPVKFPNEFERDTGYEDRTFTPEFMEGFLNLVLRKIPEILKNGIFTNESVMDEWLADSSNQHMFIKEELERCPGALLVKDSLYQQYVHWCGLKDVEVLSKKLLTSQMEQAGALINVRPKINGKQEHCYQGFKRKGEEAIRADSEKEGSTLSTFSPSEKNDNPTRLPEFPTFSKLREKQKNSTDHDLFFPSIYEKKPGKPGNIKKPGNPGYGDRPQE